MKAILEFEAPESCERCKLKKYVPKPVCVVINRNVVEYRDTRHPNCPLKIVEDNECGNCRNSVFVAVTGRLYCLVHKQAVNKNVCDKWECEV